VRLHRTDVTPEKEDAMPERSDLIDQMIAMTPDWRGEMLARLREFIHSVDPDVVEDVRWIRPANPLGTAVFEHNGIVCFGLILKGRVRLGFWEGASLPDPHGLYNAQLDGNKSRAIDFAEGAELPAIELGDLVRAGIERNLTKGKPSRPKR
jgi:hypothetical protein